MGMFRDSEAPDTPDDDFQLGGLPEPEDGPEETDEQPAEDAAFQSGAREVTFDDEDDEDLVDSDEYPFEERLGPPEEYISRRRPTSKPAKPGIGKIKIGKGTKILAASAGAIFLLVLTVSLFAGGENKQEGPSETELAAVNQANVEKRAQALMEKRLEARAEKLKKIRAARKAKAVEARKARIARERARKAAKAHEARGDATEAVPETVSTPEPAPVTTYVPPPATYTPPAPEPEPEVSDPAPAPPVETQADVNQSTASQSFGFGG